MAPRQTSAAVAEPNDWETVDPGDWQPVAQQPRTVPPPDPSEGPKIAQSLVYSRMFNVPPSTAYQMHDELRDQMKELGAHSTVWDDLKSGRDNSIFGLIGNNKMPEPLQNPDTLDKFVEGLAQMGADLPWYLFGGAAGGAAGSEVPVVGNAAGAAMGGFAVPAAIRKALVTGIQQGKVTSFRDLMGRLGGVALSAGEGAVTGLVTHGAGMGTLPIGNAAVRTVMSRAQQIAAMTVVPDVFEGKIPTAQDFAVNAALFGAMHYGAEAFGLADIAAPKIHAKMLDMYEKLGVSPNDIAAEALARSEANPEEDPIDRLNSIARDIQAAMPQDEGEQSKPSEDEAKPAEQTPVAEPPAPGLRPATRGEDGEITESKEGATPTEEKEAPESEQGFVDNAGNFYNPQEASAWMRENEPEVAKAHEQVTGSPDEPLSAEEYSEAQRRSTGVKNA